MWLHIANDSKAAADHVYARIVERIFDLDDFPQLGLQQPEIAADARSPTVMSHLIHCRTKPTGS